MRQYAVFTAQLVEFFADSFFSEFVTLPTHEVQRAQNHEVDLNLWRLFELHASNGSELLIRKTQPQIH